MLVDPEVGEPLGYDSTQSCAKGGGIAFLAAIANFARPVLIGSEIDRHRVCVVPFPIRRGLENRRTAQSSVSEEKFFAKLGGATAPRHHRRHTGKFFVGARLCRSELQRHERRAAGDDRMAKLPRYLVAES